MRPNILYRLVLLSSMICVLDDVAVCQDSRSKKSDRDTDQWVREIRPGVRLYGLVPEYTDVGKSRMFAVAPDGRTIAFAVDNEIKFWNIEQKKAEGSIKLKSSTRILEYSPDGSKIFVNGLARATASQPASAAAFYKSSFQRLTLGVWDAVTYEQLSSLDCKPSKMVGDIREGMQGGGAYIKTISVAPDGEMVAIAFGPATVLCDARTGKKQCEIIHDQDSYSNAFTRNGKQLIDSSGQFYDAETGEKDARPPIAFLSKNPNGIKVNLKRNLIAATSRQSGLVVIDLKSNKQVKMEQPRSKKLLL